MIKVGNDSFLRTQFGPKASETISQRRFLAKLFIYVKERFTIKVGNDSFLLVGSRRVLATAVDDWSGKSYCVSS